MSVDDIRGSSEFASRLPDEPGYWDELAARIVDSAEPILREGREAEAWWRPLARWSPAIGVAAAAATLLVMVVGPPEPTRPGPVSFEQLLSPEDPVAQALVAGAAVTEISAMLLLESGGER